MLACAAALLASAPAQAQDDDDYRVRVGLGAQLQPEFMGADDTEVAPLWDVDIARGTNPFRFEAPDDSFGDRADLRAYFSAGPAANIERSRKNSDVGAAVGKVPTTIEAGAFAEFLASDSIRFRGEVLKGIGGHEGLVGAVGADYFVRDGDRYVFSVGPRLLFSNGRYQRAYFGVDSDSRRWQPGCRSTGPMAASMPPRSPAGCPTSSIRASALFGFARFERLMGDAGKIADRPGVGLAQSAVGRPRPQLHVHSQALNRSLRAVTRAARQAQSPSPGSGVKYFSNLPSSPLCSSASAGLSFLRVMFGHCGGEIGVDLEPFLEPALGVGKDRLGRAFGLADAAVDALVGVDDEHVLAFVEAIDRADLDAIHIFAFDAGVGDDVGHAAVGSLADAR